MRRPSMIFNRLTTASALWIGLQGYGGGRRVVGSPIGKRRQRMTLYLTKLITLVVSGVVASKTNSDRLEAGQ